MRCLNVPPAGLAKTILQELGVELNLLVISTESAAAKALASTRGLGRMRHMEVKDLWMQALVRDGRLKLAKILGDCNPADVFTKYLDRAALTAMAALGGFRIVPAGEGDRAEWGVDPPSLQPETSREQQRSRGAITVDTHCSF